MTDQIAYLDVAAATAVGLNYKRRLLAALRISPGMTVVDVGCGPGTDLGALAGTGASVIGIDHDPRMLAEAGRRHPAVRLREGDAHDLPLDTGSVDRVRTDRVLQHVADPAAAIAEARRVLRPGGVLGMAEPDWDTLVVAGPDLAVGRVFARFVAGRVRNPTVGRELVWLAAEAGFGSAEVQAVPVVFRDFDLADRILGLHRNTARAVEEGVLTEAAAGAWLDRLRARPFLAGFTFYLVTAEG
jgi:ubiquinone/menaquinone biosynthesis C-methylase UbiE